MPKLSQRPLDTVSVDNLKTLALNTMHLLIQLHETKRASLVSMLAAFYKTSRYYSQQPVIPN